MSPLVAVGNLHTLASAHGIELADVIGPFETAHGGAGNWLPRQRRAVQVVIEVRRRSRAWYIGSFPAEGAIRKPNRQPEIDGSPRGGWRGSRKHRTRAEYDIDLGRAPPAKSRCERRSNTVTRGGGRWSARKLRVRVRQSTAFVCTARDNLTRLG
jgi:hypothetical protein